MSSLDPGSAAVKSDVQKGLVSRLQKDSRGKDGLL